MDKQEEKKPMSDVIPFVDLKTQFAANKDNYVKAMESVCLSTAYILGPEVSRFEKRFAEYIGVEEAIGVANGTDALRLACHALDIGPGDEVLIPANTFIATALVVNDLGGGVVPVDVHSETYLIDLALSSGLREKLVGYLSAKRMSTF